jgi:3-oxoacyl-[acyl-carrier-protein] synthase II
MNLAGLGIVFPGGAGVPALRAALSAGRPLTGETLVKEPVPVLKVPAAALTGNPVLAPARRADRFCKMTLLAATEALAGSAVPPERIGIILATAFGPHGTVFKFVNDLLEFGDEQASPTVFSQSVHAAAASMVAAAAHLHGPTLTVADLAFPFEEALVLADAWLASDRCDAVLVGAVDEISDVLAHVVRRKWAVASDGIARPASAEPPAYVPGEGAVFVRLERGNGPQLTVADKPDVAAAAHLFNAGALGGDDAALRRLATPSVPAQTFVSLLGHTRIGAAFHLAVAGLMRQDRRFFPDVLPTDQTGLSGGGTDVPGGPLQVISACGLRCRAITLHANGERG